jgi:hypothetical protein
MADPAAGCVIADPHADDGDDEVTPLCMRLFGCLDIVTLVRKPRMKSHARG